MKKLTFSTAEGSWKLLAIFLALAILFSAVANCIQTGGYKYNVKNITLDVRGATLSIEQYEPRNIDSSDSVPCVIIFHGGSESLSASSMVAWELAKHGFVVLNTSMYSCGLSGQPAINDDGTKEEGYFRGGVQGMYDALQYARNISYVDQTRIGLWGHSAGTGGPGGCIILEENYYTLNDRMLNVLYNEFGIEIAPEQISEDADKIAAEVLTAEQLAVYEHMKVGQQEIMKTYIKAARTSPSSSFSRKTMVAGNEVLRDPLVNLLAGKGMHEDAGTYYDNASERYRKIFHTGEDEVVRNGWYNINDYIADPEAKSTYLGTCFEIDSTTSPALAEAIENRTARMYFNPPSFHNGMLWDDVAVSQTVEFFTQTLGYNNGNLSDPATKPISTTDCSSSYATLAFTTLAFLSSIMMLIAVVAILIKTKFFASCQKELYTPTLSTKDAGFIIAIVFSFIAAFFGTYMSSNADLSFTISNATATKWLPWEPGQVRTFMQIICTALGGAVLFVLLKLFTKIKGGASVAKLSEVNVAYGWKNVGKTVFMGAILFTVVYVFAAFIKGAFSSKLMFADASFDMMPAYGFMRLAKYVLILLPFTLIISTMNNLWTIKNVSDKADTALNVLITSIGAEVVVLIALIGTFSTIDHGTVFNLHTLLPVIVLAPVMSYIYRKLYKITGSVWAGAILVAVLLAWRLSSYISHQFIYWGPDPIAAFWGIY